MIDTDAKIWVLKALLAARRPVTDEWLRNSISAAFIQVTFSADTLKGYIRDCEAAGWISGVNDELLGLVWALTPEGRIKAQQL
jgi:hypothetical protein